MSTFRLPFFRELKSAQCVLVAGAGGGFDVFSGLPIYFNLRAAGKEVFLANLTFSNLWGPHIGRSIAPALVEITADSQGSESYFPEKHLSAWFRQHGREVPIYAFHRTGPKPIIEAYRALIAELKIDTVILVDGGTDSLMRGDEIGLGTPEEDMTSIAAVHALDAKLVPHRMLACLGFGIDTFHGVCHAHVLEAIAELARAGGYLGAFSLLPEIPEVAKFIDATEYVLKQTPSRVSIVCSSILSALEGRFGDFHRTERTFGSQLFINPLMSMYWCFSLDHVARRVKYLEGMREIEGYRDLSLYIGKFRAENGTTREWKDLPM